jgi:hypothetical protein
VRCAPLRRERTGPDSPLPILFETHWPSSALLHTRWDRPRGPMQRRQISSSAGSDADRTGRTDPRSTSAPGRRTSIFAACRPCHWCRAGAPGATGGSAGSGPSHRPQGVCSYGTAWPASVTAAVTPTTATGRGTLSQRVYKESLQRWPVQRVATVRTIRDGDNGRHMDQQGPRVTPVTARRVWVCSSAPIRRRSCLSLHSPGGKGRAAHRRRAAFHDM